MAQNVNTDIGFLNVSKDKILSLGTTLVNQLYTLIKTAQIHDPNNIALVTHLENLIKTIKEFLKGETQFSLSLTNDLLYVNDTRLRWDIEGFISFNYLIEEMKKREIGSITFIDHLSAEELKRFIYIFLDWGPKSDRSFEALKGKMQRSGISNVEIEKLESSPTADKTIEHSKMAKKTYFTALSTFKGVMNNVKAGQMVEMRKAKRSVQAIVDAILKDESTLLGLTTIKNYDDYTYNHCVNVSILAIALGQRLGYDKRELSILGFSALFHDIGKIDVPIELLNKPSDFNDQEWEIMRKHPVTGAKTLIKLKGLDEVAMKSIIASFEHHINYDLTGYPPLVNKKRLHIYSRIIAIVDRYDAMTSSRVYSRTPYPPDKALSLMLEKSGTYYDPLLLKVFITMIGVYPIGTLLMLDTKELALVFEANPNPEKTDRPKVMLISDEKGNRISTAVVDLAEEKEGGGYKRSIACTLDPNKYNINMAEYFL